MAAQNQLLVSTDKYEAQISLLEGYLNQLNGVADEYEGLKNSTSSFMGDDDSQIDQLKQNVQANINHVKAAIEAVTNQIATLRTTVSSMENLGTNIGTILQGSTELASKLFT